MDKDGNMYAVYKTTGNAGYLYKLNYNSSGNGTATYLGYVGASDYNAATYYERTVNGQLYKYLIIGRGYLAGDPKAIRLNSAGTSIEQNIDITVTGGESNRKAKDFAWISDDAHPAGLDLIAYNRDASQLLGGSISHGGTPGGTETMTIATSVRASNVTGFTGTKDSGAAMYFGDGIAYFMNNNNGRLWKYDATNDTSTALNSGEWASTNFYMDNSSNTDGAGCGFGSTTEAIAVGSVSVTTSLNSCSSGTATSSIAVTASGSTMYVDVQYSTNGGSSWITLQNGNAISSGSTETYTTPAQSHSSTIQWQYRSGTSDPTSGSYTSATSRTVDCPVIDTTGASSCGSCAAGSIPSTFTMSNSSSANTTAYFRVQYSINGGDFQNAVTNQSVGINASETTSVSVPHGSTIQWQYEISNTSNTFTGTYTQESTSSAVDCPVYVVVASHSVTNCTNNGSSQGGTQGRIVLSIDNSGAMRI